MLVLSQDVFNERSQTVIVMAITSRPQRAGFPLSWRIGSGVLPKDSWVKVSQIRTLSTQRLGARLGRLSDADLQHLLGGLWQLIG